MVLEKKKMKLSNNFRIEIMNYCIIMVFDDIDDG